MVSFLHCKETLHYCKVELIHWKVISGGVFRLTYSRNKKKVYSVPAIRMPEPVSQAKVPASERQQDSCSMLSEPNFKLFCP